VRDRLVGAVNCARQIVVKIVVRLGTHHPGTHGAPPRAGGDVGSGRIQNRPIASSSRWTMTWDSRPTASPRGWQYDPHGCTSAPPGRAGPAGRLPVVAVGATRVAVRRLGGLDRLGRFASASPGFCSWPAARLASHSRIEMASVSPQGQSWTGLSYWKRVWSRSMRESDRGGIQSPRICFQGRGS